MKVINSGHREVSVEEVIALGAMTAETRRIMSLFSGYHFEAVVPVIELSDYLEKDLIISNDAGLKFADRYIETIVDGEILFQHNLYPLKDVNPLYSYRFGDMRSHINISRLEVGEQDSDSSQPFRKTVDQVYIAKISEGDDTAGLVLFLKESNDIYVMSQSITDGEKIVQFANSPISEYELIDRLCEEKAQGKNHVEIYDALLNEAISECIAARETVMKLDEQYWDLYYSIPEDVRAEL